MNDVSIMLLAHLLYTYSEMLEMALDHLGEKIPEDWWEENALGMKYVPNFQEIVDVMKALDILANELDAYVAGANGNDT